MPKKYGVRRWQKAVTLIYQYIVWGIVKPSDMRLLLGALREACGKRAEKLRKDKKNGEADLWVSLVKTESD